MLSRWDKSVAEQLDRCLSGEAAPQDPDVTAMVMAAAALRPRRPINESSRQRAFEAMMLEADRRARSAERSEYTEDLSEPAVHSRVAQAGHGLEIRMADIEAISDERLEGVAAKIAARFRQSAPDRNA
ncbi:hypothetical protein ACFVHW_04430 [Streptomyces sp. NPDC127110]|uniref:hypothetical protein n=1 Tax=Streptomyces sp. NPDC127110 TaxID=3345362 RepID=UPI00362E11F9